MKVKLGNCEETGTTTYYSAKIVVTVEDKEYEGTVTLTDMHVVNIDSHTMEVGGFEFDGENLPPELIQQAEEKIAEYLFDNGMEELMSDIVVIDG